MLIFLFTNSYGFHIDSLHEDFVFQHTITNAASFFLTYFFVCVCVLGIVCTCMFVFVMCAWRSEVNIRYFPRLLSTLIFKASSLTKSEAHHFSELWGYTCFPPTHQYWGCIYVHITMSAFYVGAGIQTKHLMVVWQGVYWLSHFPIPGTVYFKTIIFMQKTKFFSSPNWKLWQIVPFTGKLLNN